MIAEMATQLLEFEGDRIKVVQNSAVGKRGIISYSELNMLLDRRKDVFEGRRVSWKSGKASRSGVKGSSSSSRASTASPRRGGADGGLFEVYEAPTDEGNDALAHILGEEVAI